MTKDEATQILAVLKAAYPSFYKDVEGASLDLTINVWASSLSDTRFECAQRAVLRHIKKEKWPPSIAEVISGANAHDPEKNLMFRASFSHLYLKEKQNKSEFDKQKTIGND